MRKQKRRNKIKLKSQKLKVKIPVRQCISCRQEFARDNLIRLTKLSNLSRGVQEVVINPNKHQFGRSIYLCKSPNCIAAAIKSKRIVKVLKASAKELEKIIPKLESLLREEVFV